MNKLKDFVEKKWGKKIQKYPSTVVCEINYRQKSVDLRSTAQTLY